MFYWLAILIVFSLSVVIFRVIVRQDYLQRGSLSPISVFLEFLIFGLHANLPYLYLAVPWPLLPPLPESTLQLALGLGFCILGLMATLAIMAYLGFTTTVGEQPNTLRQTGPYHWSRNPQLLTYGLMLLGCVVLYPSWQSAAWAALYGAIAHTMVLTEEEHLENLFGAEYQDYRRQVPRYLRSTGSGNILRKTKE